ncbi:MAG: hypothetical protein EOO46_10040 [Flavobacterium sp.]|nr:MAG: hypothetical protein EOO46_10040 [Flavobacterium sp.]
MEFKDESDLKKNNPSKDDLEPFFLVCRLASKDLFTKISKEADLEIKAASKIGAVGGEYSSYIDIQSSDLNIRFSSYFSIKNPITLPHSSRQPEMTDLFMEYHNQVAGRIRVKLSEIDISTTMGYPQVEETTFLVKPSNEWHSYELWTVKGSDFSFTCSAAIKISDAETAKKIRSINSQTPSAGIILF